MPLSRDPDAPKRWLERARGNLLRAGSSRPEGTFLEDYCFDAQQAAEKALKAVYLANGIEFAWTHDIDRLITALRDAGVAVPMALDAAADLTVYAAIARYPDAGMTTMTDADCLEAVRLAEAVVG